MSFRIDSIKVNRGGPLKSDFIFRPGDLNLIYGPNESGKTYVIESLIKLLFKDKSAWKSRKLDGEGVIMVSGLKDDPVAFKAKSRKKLEEYWEVEAGLPPALSRLLIVRAGETRLSEEEGDGVGRGILKEYLSGTGLLDKIDKRVPATIRKATVPYRGVIEGDHRPPLTTRTEIEEKVAGLKDLQDQFERQYLSTEASLLRQEKAERELALDALKKAKRYHAWNLSEQKNKVAAQINEMPTGEELGKLESEIKKYWDKEKKLTLRSQRIAELENTGAHFQWAETALARYDALISSPENGELSNGPWVASFISVVMILIGVWTGMTPLVITGSILVLISVSLAYRNSKKKLGQSGVSAELELIRSGYRDRFDSELADIAVLEVKVNGLRNDHVLLQRLKEEVEDISQEKTDLEVDITNRLRTWTGDEVPVEKFEDIRDRLKRERQELQEQLDSSSENLAQVGVPPQEYLGEDPGERWNPERHNEIKDQLANVSCDLSEVETGLHGLKKRFEQETDLTDGAEWETLITRLDKKHEEKQQEYRNVTADILARMQVHTAIVALREEEDVKIDAGLEEDSLTDLLYSVTGRYKNIQQVDIDGRKQLAVIPDHDEEYLVENMSTGVREQILLALRMSFASRVMDGRSGFLILDDAFQHSDYSRRKRLVDQTVNLVTNGWQIFYFTMDDHIRDLFLEIGNEMGDQFKQIDWSA